MTTFSQLVDTVLQNTGQRNMLVGATLAMNQTIREMHMHPDHEEMFVLYDDNLVEVEAVADSATGYQYEIPNRGRFQNLFTVYYADKGVYADKRSPATAFRDGVDSHFYYRTGPVIAFNDYGGTNATIALAMYYYPPALTYYQTADRPAVWSDVTQAYSYHTDYAADNAGAEALTTNWILERWADCVRLGTEAKIYNRLNHEGPQNRTYSQYQSMRKQMLASETCEVIATYGP